jgi:hypothetical protein
MIMRGGRSILFVIETAIGQVSGPVRQEAKLVETGYNMSRKEGEKQGWSGQLKSPNWC